MTEFNKIQNSAGSYGNSTLGYTRNVRKTSDRIRTIKKVSDILIRVNINTLKWNWPGQIARRNGGRWTSVVLVFNRKGRQKPIEDHDIYLRQGHPKDLRDKLSEYCSRSV